MEIRRLDMQDMEEALKVIHFGFATAAQQFSLTEENCPTNGAFMSMERLKRDWESGVVTAGSFENGRMTGYVQVRILQDGLAEMEKLCVIPEARNCGTGAALADWAQAAAREMGARRLLIGIIEKNTKLKAWYEKMGFVHLGTRQFPFLPFTVGYMEMQL